MARQVGVALVAEGLAVDLEIGAGAPLLPPQRVLAERAVLGIEVFLPQRGRLDDMAVGVEYNEVFRHHPLLIGATASPVVPAKAGTQGDRHAACPGPPLARG